MSERTKFQKNNILHHSLGSWWRGGGGVIPLPIAYAMG